MEHTENGSTLGRVLYWAIVVVAVVVAFKLAFWALGAVFGFGLFLLFRVAPLVLIGWLVVKAFRHLTKPAGSADAA